MHPTDFSKTSVGLIFIKFEKQEIDSYPIDNGS